MIRQELSDYFDQLLDPGSFADYGPNGLQIEGRSEVTRVAFSVSATVESVSAAVQKNADALVVHHGLFWNFHGVRPLTGPFARRIFPLVRNQLNLFAYHLPLDAHPAIGNAASLGRLIGVRNGKPFGDYKGCPTGIQGSLETPLAADQLQARLASALNHEIILSTPDPTAVVTRIGIITGGANSEWSAAVRAGLDAYVTGEISEHDWHDAREAGIHMYAGGHHATERPGILSLMENVRNATGLDCFFIDSENPA